MNKKIIISTIIVIVVLGVAYFLSAFPAGENIFVKNQIAQPKLSSAEIMQIIKTDKDYNDLSGFVTGFDPEIAVYEKLGPVEYKKIKPQWQEKGFGDRVTAVDKIILTDSTYWIELKDKKDETKGLRMLLDVKEKKSLLLIASLSIKAGIGI